MTINKQKVKRTRKRDISLGALGGITLTIIGIIVTLIMGPVGPYLYDFYFLKKNFKDNIVLMGSGTVIKYLEPYKERYLSNVYIMDCPSGSALEILTRGRGEFGNIKMIAMSSSQFDESKLEQGFKYQLIEIQLPRKNYFIVELTTPNIGKFSNIIYPDKEFIRINEILDTIKNKDFDVYISCEKSGHRINYESIFRNVDNSFKWPIDERLKIFDVSAVTLNTLKSSHRPSIVLCSELYKIDGIGKEYKILDKDHDNALNDNLYIYLLSTSKENIKIDKDGIFTFNRQFKEGYLVENFLKELDSDYSIKLINSIEDKIIKIQIVK